MTVLNELFHITKFEYVKKKYVTGIREDTFNHEATVILGAGGSWQEIDFTPGTATIGEKRIISERGGNYFKQRFSGSLPARLAGYPETVQAWTKEPVVCRLTLSNGKVLIAGSAEGPVRLQYDLSSDGHDVNVTFERNALYGLMTYGS